MNDRFHMKKTALVLCAVVAVACEGGMNSPGVAERGGWRLVGAERGRLEPEGHCAAGDFAAVRGDQHQHDADAGRSRRRGPLRAAPTLSQRFQVSDRRLRQHRWRTAWASIDASGVDPVHGGSRADRRQAIRVARPRRDERRRRSLVERDGVHDRRRQPRRSPTGPTSALVRAPRIRRRASACRCPTCRACWRNSANAADSCPRGLKYVNNPWQDRVIDAFRQRDTRWGYNGKPTRTAADNNGVPVVAAGDEAAYHYSGGPDQGSPEVHLVDMLGGHCGAAPTITWRVFTGEEPGFWTGAGRF